MSLSNAELTDEVRDLKRRMDRAEERLDAQAQKIADIKQTVNVNLWEMALETLEEA